MSKPKLTLSQVREIRVAPGSLRQIGKRFGVTPKTVWEIKAERIWKQINRPINNKQL